jgi:hypothetical protein
LNEKTKEKIEVIVRHIIDALVAEGQFEECDLTTRDIGFTPCLDPASQARAMTTGLRRLYCV